MRHILFALLLSSLCWTQTIATTGQAESKTPCSVANTGNDNKIEIDCGIGKEQGQKMLAILNRILAKNLDLQLVMAKLDELTKSNASSGLLLSASTPALPRIEFGDSGASLVYTGPDGKQNLTFLEDSSLTVERIDDHIAVSTLLRDASGRVVAEIERNEWKIRPPLVWDRNYNDNSLEVINETGDVVLQIVVLPDRIRIQAIWYDKSGNFFEIVKSPDPNRPGGLFVRKPSIPVKIIPIFMYPSERHLGEMKKP